MGVSVRHKGDRMVAKPADSPTATKKLPENLSGFKMPNLFHPAVFNGADSQVRRHLLLELFQGTGPLISVPDLQHNFPIKVT